MNLGRWVHVAADAITLAEARSPAELSRRTGGIPITGHRSSWVRRWSIDSVDLYIKTYDYRSSRDRRRGIGRNTWFAPSRARREQRALDWLAAHGFVGPRALAVGEIRNRCGMLRRAILVTEAWPGTSLDRLLPAVAADQRAALLEAVETLVDRLHRAGFRDGNLDPRNLLAKRATDTAWQVAKIDSPRFRLVRPGTPTDRWAVADRARLAAGLSELI